MKVYYEADSTVVIEIDGGVLAISRQEAEALFVDLGHTLQDMDVTAQEFDNAETGDQPDV